MAVSRKKTLLVVSTGASDGQLIPLRVIMERTTAKDIAELATATADVGGFTMRGERLLWSIDGQGSKRISSRIGLEWNHWHASGFKLWFRKGGVSRSLKIGARSVMPYFRKTLQTKQDGKTRSGSLPTTTGANDSPKRRRRRLSGRPRSRASEAMARYTGGYGGYLLGST